MFLPNAGLFGSAGTTSGIGLGGSTEDGIDEIFSTVAGGGRPRPTSPVSAMSASGVAASGAGGAGGSGAGDAVGGGCDASFGVSGRGGVLELAVLEFQRLAIIVFDTLKGSVWNLLLFVSSLYHYHNFVLAKTRPFRRFVTLVY